MQYKMVILDLDDTLLLSNGKISEANKKALKLAQEKGVKVVLASGRPTFAMKNIAKELELEKYNGYMLSYNGSIVTDCNTGNILYETSLTKEEVENLYKLSLEHECYIHTYDGDTIITSHDNPYTYIESEITGMPINVYEDFVSALPKRCVKAIMVQAPKHLQEVQEMLKSKMNDKMTMAISKPYFLEFMNKEVDKGKSLLRLCQQIDINIENTIAIGDSYNDLSLIKMAGFGVAMGNAVEEIKEIADYITENNENDGVAKAIEKFILN